MSQAGARKSRPASEATETRRRAGIVLQRTVHALLQTDRSVEKRLALRLPVDLRGRLFAPRYQQSLRAQNRALIDRMSLKRLVQAICLFHEPAASHCRQVSPRAMLAQVRLIQSAIVGCLLLSACAPPVPLFHTCLHLHPPPAEALCLPLSHVLVLSSIVFLIE